MKDQFPARQARAVAEALIEVLAPCCVDGFCVIAGSLRRECASVGDIEIVFVSRMRSQAKDLFASEEVPVVDAEIARLLAEKELRPRKSPKGASSWGPQNKYAVHFPSGIPVDMFATSIECFPNYLVCRTGSAALNLRIAKAANAKGWSWNNTGSGFTQWGSGKVHTVRTEADVFEFAGMKYLKPKERV